MKEKKSIGSFLFKNYIILFVFLIFCIFLTQYISSFIIKEVVFNNSNWKRMESEEFYEIPFDNINISNIQVFDGWIEILDEHKKVIFTKGNKMDNIYQYEERFLYDNCGSMHKDSSKYPFVYNIFPVKGPKGEPYLYLIKFPKKSMDVSLSANLLTGSKKSNTIHIAMLIVIFSVFLTLFLPGLYLHSKIIAKLNSIEEEKLKLAESKHRMLVDISHDLKTPITSIYGFSKLLHDGDVSSDIDRQKYIKYIYNKADYVAKLIDDIFELSKLEEDNFRFTFEKADFAEWLRRAVSQVYSEFEEKKILLEVDISEAPIILSFDKKQMMRVVYNLINNSLKYTLENTKVPIYCHEVNERVIFKISDNGVGISDELKDIIFNPFVKGHQSTGSKDGTGLGLAITKRIIQKHSGTIVLLSNETYKTIFKVELPM